MAATTEEKALAHAACEHALQQYVVGVFNTLAHGLNMARDDQERSAAMDKARTGVSYSLDLYRRMRGFVDQA